MKHTFATNVIADGVKSKTGTDGDR